MPDKYSLICKKVKPHEIKNNLLFKQRSLLSMTVILIYDGRFIHFSGEKNLELFRRRKDLLDTFLSTGAISLIQHDKSLTSSLVIFAVE